MKTTAENDVDVTHTADLLHGEQTPLFDGAGYTGAERVTKRQFGFVKARYCGLAKNGAQIQMLFALSNLRMARHVRYCKASAPERWKSGSENDASGIESANFFAKKSPSSGLKAVVGLLDQRIPEGT